MYQGASHHLPSGEGHERQARLHTTKATNAISDVSLSLLRVSLIAWANDCSRVGIKVED